MASQINKKVFLAGCLLAGSLALFAHHRYLEQESDICLDKRIQSIITHQHGERSKPSIFSFGRSIASAINNKTIMRGASTNWDKERLINGKFSQMQKIGGEVTVLNTNSGDQIVGCYFGLPNFSQKITEMGGRMVHLTLHFNHPFFKEVEPIELHICNKSFNLQGARVPYQLYLEKEFLNPQEFIELCHKNNMKVLWEDTLSEVAPGNWYHFYSRQKDIIIISSRDEKTLQASKAKDELSIKKGGAFENSFSIFDPKVRKGKAIIFDRNKDQVEKLFSRDGVKIESAGWDIISYQASTIFAELELGDQLYKIEKRKINQLPMFSIETENADLSKLKQADGAVILSMNQTNSFTQYTHEILKFLLMGTHVFAYDNAGKGLSQGKNSQKGMKDAAISAGRFLINDLGFDEKKVVFKAQCSGGLPLSEAVAEEFRNAHLWVDQAPSYYPDVVEKMVHDKIVEKVGDQRGRNYAVLKAKVTTLTFVVACPIAVISRLFLPSCDVICNFKKTKGLKIFTIGVPDKEKYGGDQLVPIKNSEAIQMVLQKDQDGYFLPMEGATHVTDWWKDPEVEKKVQQIFSENKLLCCPFPVKAGTL